MDVAEVELSSEDLPALALAAVPSAAVPSVDLPLAAVAPWSLRPLAASSAVAFGMPLSAPGSNTDSEQPMGSRPGSSATSVDVLLAVLLVVLVRPLLLELSVHSGLRSDALE